MNDQTSNVFLIDPCILKDVVLPLKCFLLLSDREGGPDAIIATTTNLFRKSTVDNHTADFFYPLKELRIQLTAVDLLERHPRDDLRRDM